MEFLGSIIGKPLYFDSPTSTMRASSFARICIEMKRSLYVLLDRRRQRTGQGGSASFMETASLH
jgi:hypothetical protein